MNIKHLRIFIICFLPLIKAQSQTPQYQFEVFAGSTPSFKDAQGKAAQMESPEGIAMDKNGNIYTTEYRTSIIRKIDPQGNVTLLAGQPMKTGYADGKSTEALIDRPHGIEVDKAGNVYFCDMKNHLIRKVDNTGMVSTFAGTPKTSGTKDGKANEAQFNQPEDLAFDSKGNLYVADTYNFTIRKIDTQGNVTTFSGKAGVNGYADGQGNAALFDRPLGIAIDKKDNIYVADANYDGTPSGNCLVRKIDKKGNVTTFAGVPMQEGNRDGQKNQALLHRPVGIAVDKKGSIYLADTEGDVIRLIDKKGNVTTIGGQYLQEKSAEGIGNQAAFFDPQALVVAPNGDIYIADTHNSKVIKGRKIK